MPGHGGLKQKADYTPEQKKIYTELVWFQKKFFSFDVTEIGETDNLSAPTGIIKKSEENLARIYGAKRGYYLVNGSSAGVLSAVNFLVHKREKVIIQDISHKSVLNICRINELETEVLPTKRYGNFGFTGKISLRDLNRTLDENPDAKAVIITSPDYFGTVQDIYEISKAVHENNMYLIVDMAHGAHFVYSDLFCDFATRSGADIAVTSFHKTLPAMNQTAVLFAGYSLGDDICNGLQESINLFQTTSPSYPMMVNMEIAAECLDEYGEKIYSDLEKNVDELKKELSAQKNIFILKNGDFSRLVIGFRNVNTTFANSILTKKFGIIPEMYNDSVFVFILNIFHTKDDLKKLRAALIYLANAYENYDIAEDTVVTDGLQDELYSYLLENIGQKSDKTIYIYPPGNALVKKGECITQNHLKSAEPAKAGKSVRLLT